MSFCIVYHLYFLFFFFFFQAEDGIRDHCVTGVQTCALPISPREPRAGPEQHASLGAEAAECRRVAGLDDERGARYGPRHVALRPALERRRVPPAASTGLRFDECPHGHAGHVLERAREEPGPPVRRRGQEHDGRLGFTSSTKRRASSRGSGSPAAPPSRTSSTCQPPAGKDPGTAREEPGKGEEGNLSSVLTIPLSGSATSRDATRRPERLTTSLAFRPSPFPGPFRAVSPAVFPAVP